MDVLNTRPVLQPHPNNASNIAALREYSSAFDLLTIPNETLETRVTDTEYTYVKYAVF
jgi:hypothetical protein